MMVQEQDVATQSSFNVILTDSLRSELILNAL
jgi:hypothetical protein